jgi:hypothetical protein
MARDEAARQRCYQIGVRKVGKRHHESRHGQGNAALEAAPR